MAISKDYLNDFLFLITFPKAKQKSMCFCLPFPISTRKCKMVLVLNNVELVNCSESYMKKLKKKKDVLPKQAFLKISTKVCIANVFIFWFKEPFLIQ